LAPEIHKAFNQSCSGTYLEPFTGSGAVFLYMRAQGLVRRAVLSDANPKLMAVHIAVRDRVEEVLAALGRLPSEDWRERYYDVRDAYNRGPWEGPEHAARFIWLNRAGFNGLYRENRSGEFNVPLGRYARLSLPAPEHFRAVSGLFAGVEMVTCDFGELMSRARAGDHIYCDPPYVPLSETASFTGYCKEPFGHAEQRRLADAARLAGARGARVVLSNHDLPVVRHELYREADGFAHMARPRVSRAISRSAVSRGRVAEVLAAIGPERLSA
jgi:DNA adenine methylase